ncbi:MAG: FAD-binding oxidoreductase [Prosthecobacter sp.]
MSFSPVEILAYLVFFACGGLLVLMLVRQVASVRRMRVLHRRELALFEERLNGMREYRTRLQVLPAAWSGTRKFRVRTKKNEGGDICSFHLVPHDEKTPLPTFKPGQYLTFHLDIGGRKHVRCYSLSDCHHSDHYRVSIKKMTPKDAHFSVSTYFHEQLHEGDVVDVAAPGGDFFLDSKGKGGVVLSGAGVGVTPVLSMLNALVAAKSQREIWFFYGVVNGSHHILRDKVSEWRALGWPNLHIVVVFSDPRPTDEIGSDYDERGRVDPALFKRLLPSGNFDYYSCGPGPMMQGIRDGLREWGVDDSRVHDEAFVQVKQAVSINATKISFRKSNLDLELSGAATNVLDFAHKENIEIPSGCKIGHCGACQTALIEGKVRYLQPPKFNIEKGCCLPCICLPEGDIVLDA